ncbi:MAG TPA: L-ribulose-5-phosphate 4-epimerase AraD [Spirochaetia bacterium]|nr:L-ribulose-5-phosphate 4-epimerase AraD [Spirochaetia bacterium]
MPKDRFSEIRANAYRANMMVRDEGLVILTWGNASQVDRELGVMAIKPSGVDYDNLSESDMVIVSLETGKVVDGDLRPSSDTPTHLVLYRAFAGVGGIVHTHSHFGTCWAQAGRPIPCFGTTHADSFHGEIPLTRRLTASEIDRGYEAFTGEVIVERFHTGNLNPVHTPGVLVVNHGPFVWGKDALDAAHNAIILEEVARMALHTLAIEKNAPPAPPELTEKHFQRKHGTNAYYGQPK